MMGVSRSAEIDGCVEMLEIKTDENKLIRVACCSKFSLRQTGQKCLKPIVSRLNETNKTAMSWHHQIES